VAATISLAETPAIPAAAVSLVPVAAVLTSFRAPLHRASPAPGRKRPRRGQS
jgi:hypothetical protein